MSEVESLQLSQPVYLKQRQKDFDECHTFEPNDTVIVIISKETQLTLIEGRVVQCYRNFYGIIIYVMRSMPSEKIDYQVPRWLVFHFQEDAIFTLHELFSEEDRNQILGLSTPESSFLAENLRLN